MSAGGEGRALLDAHAAGAWGVSQILCRPGAVIVTENGAVRVRPDGGLEPVDSFGHRSAASDPARRGAR